MSFSFAPWWILPSVKQVGGPVEQSDRSLSHLMSTHRPSVLPASSHRSLTGNVLVIHCYSVWQFVFVICLLLLPSPVGLTSGWPQRQLSLAPPPALSFLCVISTCMTTIELFKKCYQEKREKTGFIFQPPPDKKSLMTGQGEEKSSKKHSTWRKTAGT